MLTDTDRKNIEVELQKLREKQRTSRKSNAELRIIKLTKQLRKFEAGTTGHTSLNEILAKYQFIVNTITKIEGAKK